MKKIKEKKLTNAEIEKRIQKRKILLYPIFLFGIATIVLSIFSIFDNLSPIFAIITFLIEAIISKYRDSLITRSTDSDQKNQE